MTSVQPNDRPGLASSQVQHEATIMLSEQLVLDLAHRSIRRGSAVIALSELEWGVVAALLVSQHPLSTNDLLEQVWHDRYADPRLVWAVIDRLRRKVEPDPRHPRFVLRNRSFGYWLVLRESEVSGGVGEGSPVLTESAIGGAR